MTALKWAWLPIVFFLACGETEESDLKVIYGDDDRKDLFELSSSAVERDWASSTVALVRSRSFSTNGGVVSFQSAKFGQSYNLCQDEPFREQINPAFCSGFLVAEDKIATAGHCISSVSDCRDTKFVFDLAISSSGNKLDQVKGDDVYSCKKVIHSQADGNGADFAIIELDRKVEGRTPLEFRRSGNPSPGTRLTLIGHPSGLPTKVAKNAVVRRIVGSTHLVASTDSYGGNSGSAVFNSEDGVVEGILVRGEQDFVFLGGCRRSKRCGESQCRGEDVTLSSKLSSYVEGEQPDPEPDATVFADLAPGLRIPDADRNGVTLEFDVESDSSINQLNVEVDLSHTYIGDLVITLTPPSGSGVTLHDRRGGSRDDIKVTYNSENTPGLSAWNGNSAKGTWKLKISDRARIDLGQLNSLRLSQGQSN